MSEGMFLFILIVVIFMALALVVTLLSALFKKRKQLKRYQSIMDLEAEQAKVKRETEKMRQSIEQGQKQKEKGAKPHFSAIAFCRASARSRSAITAFDTPFLLAMLIMKLGMAPPGSV